MVWEKLGRIFDPQGARWWMQSHAALPTPIDLGGGHLRVYCSGRDSEGRSRIGSADLQMRDPAGTCIVAAEPVLELGVLGTYEDRGVLPASIARRDEGSILYYTGVMLGRTVPFYFAVGAATAPTASGPWTRLSNAPVLDRNAVDPLLTASPFVMHDGGSYRMWYVSASRWVEEAGGPKHYYHIRYAESDDGIAWRRDGRVCIDFRGNEYAIARPCVVRDADRYRMWYAYRGASYRIGYAESRDGIAWERKDDEAGIEPSSAGWDSQMLCYAHIFDHDGVRYMLYNGNDYGKTGFGLARLRA